MERKSVNAARLRYWRDAYVAAVSDVHVPPPNADDLDVIARALVTSAANESLACAPTERPERDDRTERAKPQLFASTEM